ncbi:MAG: hypothetical protein ACQETZ_03635 [Candidatus Fermentibacterota bacterium]
MLLSRREERGSALALVVVFGLVLSILVAGLFVLFRANTESFVWKRDNMQARYSAEAGTALAVHMIMGGADVPGGDMPQAFLGSVDPEVWYDLPGDLGEVMVYVDPHDENEQVASANSYAVRGLARIPTSDGYRTYGMETAVMPENFARFACFLDEPDLSGAYADGYRFDGPFFANDPVRVVSNSPGRNNDPWFYSFQLTSDYYVAGWGSTHATTPHPLSDLYLEPYERMLLGPPYFELGAEPIPFGPSEVKWQAARDAAQSGGIFFDGSLYPSLPSGTRMIVGSDSIWARTPGGTEYSYFIADTALAKRVIWVENGPGDQLWIKGDPTAAVIDSLGVDSLLTIGCNGDIWFYGPLLYANDDMDDPENKCMLGLISIYGDLVMADDPDDNSGIDWASPFHIEMGVGTGGMGGEEITYDAVVMALSGEFKAERYWEPTPMSDFNLVGGYIVNNEGYTTTSGAGLNSVIHYDTRLMTMHPPYFPQTGKWGTVYWKEWPELSLDNIEENTYY